MDVNVVFLVSLVSADLHCAGLMLILEHRYYGQSRPLPDLGVKNLAWLSSHQALADIARFIISINKVREVIRDRRL